MRGGTYSFGRRWARRLGFLASEAEAALCRHQGRAMLRQLEGIADGVRGRRWNVRDEKVDVSWERGELRAAKALNRTGTDLSSFYPRVSSV